MHIGALDGLRGMAALIVFTSHYTLLSGLLNGLLGSGSGQIGVMLFFCLSGYLMAHLYLDKKPTLSSVYTYLVRRFVRVVPLFYAVVISVFTFNSIFPDFNIGYPVKPLNLNSHLLFIRGVGALWTIPVEIQFYGIFCIFWIAIFGRRYLIMFIIVLLVFMYWNDPYWLNFISRMRIFTPVLIYFFLGILAYCISDFHRRGLYDAIFTIFFIGAICLFPRIYESILGVDARELDGKLILSLWSNPLYMMTTFGLIYSLIHSKFWYNLFSKRLFSIFGKISYSFYIIHVPVLFIIKNYIPIKDFPITGFFICLIATFLTALFSFICFERPSNRFLSKALLGPIEKPTPKPHN
ncbi:MAG: acyltransferase [Pseudomonadota bacterium]